MNDLIQTLQQTPLPTILVIAGIFFIFLSIAGGLSGKINVPQHRQQMAAIFGSAFLIAGLAMHLVPSQPSVTEPVNGTQGPDADTTERTITEGASVAVEPFHEWPLVADETFTSSDNQWTTGSFTDDGSQLEMRTVSGKYRWDGQFSKSWYRYQLSPYEPALDCYVAVDMKLLSNAAQRLSGGIVVRRSGDQDYRLYIHSDRYFILYHFDNGTFNILIDWTYIPNVDPAKTNRIALLAEGPLLRVYINDRLFGEVSDTALSGGNVGLVMVGHEDTGTSGTIDFDNFEFRRKH